MDQLPPKAPRPDTTGWPVAQAVPTDVYLGEFVHDCWPNLTAEQKAWPVVPAVPTDIFLGSYDQDGKRLDVPPGDVEASGVDILAEFTDTAREPGRP